jgi:hypothetical protein
MIGRLAFRSLTAHPIRSAVLAAGFGAGVGVMAILLGVAEVVLDQASSPSLIGGGDVVVRMAPQIPARMVLSGTLQAADLRDQIEVAAPWRRDQLFLVREDGTTLEVDARGGIPSMERALNDRETAGFNSWTDTAEDVDWIRTSPEDALRQVDRFHPVPAGTQWSDSWAEWLYFNGRAANARFYLTFLVGPRNADGTRAAGVRLQLDRNGNVESFSGGASLTDEQIARAPELVVGGNRIRLDGLKYLIDLDLQARSGARLTGQLTVEGKPGRLIPPLEIVGARGWRSGYVVPVMSGTLDGALRVNGQPLSFAGGSGYHDHNWGFWEGVSWQWGQVQQGELSLLYGRVFPPRDAADPERFPGFMGVIGPNGPLGYATNVTITEQNDDRGQPKTITVRGRGQGLDLEMRFAVGSMVTTRMEQGPIANGIDFLQMRGSYAVSGEAGERKIEFTAPGSAETFRGAK